jgi:hypothetical protein
MNYAKNNDNDSNAFAFHELHSSMNNFRTLKIYTIMFRKLLLIMYVCM